MELDNKMIQNMTVLNMLHNISPILRCIHLFDIMLFTVASLVKLSVCVCGGGSQVGFHISQQR